MVYDVTYNASAASAWTAGNCASGDGKRFGSCEVDVGVVGPDGETVLTVVVKVGG